MNEQLGLQWFYQYPKAITTQLQLPQWLLYAGNSMRGTSASFYIEGQGWIDGLFSGYFSCVIARLFTNLQTNIKANNITIISARDKYIETYGINTEFNGEIAKTECMERIFSSFKNSINTMYRNQLCSYKQLELCQK